MYLEMEKKEHSGREECSKCKIRALILHSEGIFVFSLHPAPLGHFRLEAAKKKCVCSNRRNTLYVHMYFLSHWQMCGLSFSLPTQKLEVGNFCFNFLCLIQLLVL